MRISVDNRDRFAELRTIALPPELREIYGSDLDLLPAPPSGRPLVYLGFVMSREGRFGL